MGFGHYTAYAKNHVTDKWYEYDDTEVREVDSNEIEQNIVSNKAYNLF